MGLVVGIILGLIGGILVGRDAAKRGMNGIGWGVFTLLALIVAVPVYLIVRGRKPSEDKDQTGDASLAQIEEGRLPQKTSEISDRSAGLSRSGKGAAATVEVGSSPVVLAKCLKWGGIALALVFVAYVIVQILQKKMPW